MAAAPTFMTGVPELLVLRLLQDREMYGYEIVAAVAEATDRVVAPKEGVVYPLLHALEREGLLRAQRRAVGGRTRVYYGLTSKGVRRLFDLSDDWSRMARAIQQVLKGPTMPFERIRETPPALTRR